MSDKYDYNRFGSKGKRVGQAVYDILSKDDNPVYTAQDIIDASSEKFCRDMEEAIENAYCKYESPFYIFVITKKDPHLVNVVRNYFIARQTPPYATDMMSAYPHASKTLYIVNYEKGFVKVCWSLPSVAECVMVLSNPDANNPELVQWIETYAKKGLDKDSYSFD